MINGQLTILLAVVVATVGYGVSFPLLAITLEKLQFSSSLIGLNAAMPALGWILASLVVPKFHVRYGSRTLMLFFISIAMIGLIGFTFTSQYVSLLLCRILFGGGLGMLFRTVEYRLNASATKENRGRLFSIYIILFLLGIVVGSLLQPALGLDSLVPYVFIFACLFVSAILIFYSNYSVDVGQNGTSDISLFTSAIKIFYAATPIAVGGALVYGLIESIPAYLMPVYALKSGFDDASAAYTLTAFAAGNILLAFPLGILSDKLGRLVVIIGCVVVSVLCFSLLPMLVQNLKLFYLTLFMIGGCIVGLYSSSLALIGDHFSESELISINASFGVVYAIGSLFGPLIHGFAMNIYEPNGMIVTVSLVFFLFLIYAFFSTRGAKRT